MIKITSEQFEELKRLQEPEVFTEAQMNAWVEGLKDTLVKAEVDELDEQEKAVVDEFNHEFTSFTKVQVISIPSESELSKGLKYDNFFIREKQVEWIEAIEKSEDKEEQPRTGIYLDTKLNREMNRVGLVFGEKVEKGEEDELEKGGEGSKGGKIIGHTKSGKPIYDNPKHPSHKNFSPSDHVDALDLHRAKSKEAHSAWQESNNKRATYDKDEHGQAKNYKQREATPEEKTHEDSSYQEYVKHSGGEFYHSKQAKKKLGIHSSHDLSLRAAADKHDAK